ncbi:QueT transporter family protein [Clostridium sp. cel8]|uniref:QueT transporter family protein n=1 Tax=unclassified Clostridium TaxID=2614128 RepID=UPI0015F6ED55|nr:QueT transporter family protein [Clostridium sp. cel8]MBA5850204.1 QueT transporter family protein [Clostridium sp. cel8]
MTKTNKLVKITLVAAIYIVSTIAFGQMSYMGPIELRFSEMLNLLAFIDPYYIISLTLGCAVANFYSFSIVDVFVGSLQTLISTYLMWKTRNMAISIIWPVIGVAAIAEELHILYKLPFFYTFFTQFVGELAVMILGYFVFKKIFHNSELLDIIKIKSHNPKIENLKMKNLNIKNANVKNIVK